MQNKVSIIGAGNVGSALAFLLAQKELAKIVLIDIDKDMAIGKTLDIYQACSALGIDCKIYGSNAYEDVSNSAVVVITAGFPRKAGMDRAELLAKNASIIKDIVKNIVKYAPNSIILMVTNPLDVMTYYAFKLSGFDRTKVLGEAGMLDTSRFATFISQKLNFSIQNINSLIFGTHNDKMFTINRYINIGGFPISLFMKTKEIKKLIERTKKGGEEIIKLLKTSSASYAPAASCFRMIEAILKDKKYICCSSIYLDGEYGIKDVCIGLPVKLGKNGVEEIIKLPLTAKEKKYLLDAASNCKELIKQLPF
ncbi:MAG: malate dehydrogenase [Candidatus Omnitrophica bacterium]|nr:malate dehydrogenase [Candidatus Omnitrophota bacterium]